MTIKRIAPLSGLAFVVLLVVTFVVLGGGSSAPRTGASGATIASFYTRHHATAMAAGYLLPIAVLLLLVFAVAFWQGFRDHTTLSAGVFLAGAITASACLVSAAATHFALAQGAKDKLALASLQAINAIDQPASFAFAAIAIMVLGAAGVLIGTEQRLARIMGYVAVVVAVIGLSPAGNALFPLSALWIAVLSVMLFTGAIPMNTHARVRSEPTAQ